MGPYLMLWAYLVTEAYTDQAHSTLELQHNSSFLMPLQKWDGNVIDAVRSRGAFLLGILCYSSSWNLYLRGFSFGNWCATSAESSADEWWPNQICHVWLCTVHFVLIIRYWSKFKLKSTKFHFVDPSTSVEGFN